MGETFVQKAADGSVCKLWHHFPKVCNFTNHEKSGQISAPTQCQARFNLKYEKKFFIIII